jgi:hypothetical protein
MITFIHKFTLCLTACLLACVTVHAYEQDNWYLHGPIDGNLTGVFHQEYNATAKKDMLYKTVAGVGLEVRDINGTLLQTINTGGTTFTDIEYDQNTSRLFGINAGKLTCYEQNSSGGWSEQWRSTQGVSWVVQGPSGKLFCSNASSKIYTFEQNGTMSEFGWVDGINSMSGSYVVGVAPSGILVVNAVHNESGGSSKRRIFYFNENGDYINSIYSNLHDSTIQFIVMSPSGWVSFRGDSYYWKLYHPNGASLAHLGIEISLWLQNGDFISGSNLYRRTFRTKMETNHNSVPEPVIHRIAQRAGTNILELDFEVIDTDDDNVTVGVLAYCGSDILVPQSWLNGTGSKIGTPISTNTVHSMEWDVKQDWNASTGDIKFEIICQDGSRDKPVDLHFLKLPFEDGNMTISRSPLKDSDVFSYAKFLLSTGLAQFDNNFSFAASTLEIQGDPPSSPYLFTNCSATGRSGPSEAQISAEYVGGNLEGVTTGWKNGYQKWTVPTSQNYWIEAYGARGGNSASFGGGGSYVRGKFALSEGQELQIVVGQMGTDRGNVSYSAAGGGGTFVVADTNSTPLLVAGGGGGANGLVDSELYSPNSDGAGSDSTYYGGTNGSGGRGGGSGGGGGFLGNGTSWYPNQGGLSYQAGAIGGDAQSSGVNGGFGGGGSTHHSSWRNGGGGGGYSGGAGHGDNGVGGGGGSYSSGTDSLIVPGINRAHGYVKIYPTSSGSPSTPGTPIITGSFQLNGGAYDVVMKALGSNYRLATSTEVTKAREAATPGGVNNWTATNQVKPRNLPGKVNEYGFDVSTTSGNWVIKE